MKQTKLMVRSLCKIVTVCFSVLHDVEGVSNLVVNDLVTSTSSTVAAISKYLSTLGIYCYLLIMTQFHKRGTKLLAWSWDSWKTHRLELELEVILQIKVFHICTCVLSNSYSWQLVHPDMTPCGLLVDWV